MATLKLEILRHGPAQNQLLSPLTEYLALCGDQPASTISLPFEHAELLDRLRALAYTDDDHPDSRREARLRALGETMSGILGQIPGLVSECSRYARDNDILHLRLVLSANELALLPFEASISPAGFPGAGEFLTLQNANQVCLTREVRRAAPPAITWPSRSRILFASAAPSSLPEVPTRAHTLALLRAVDAWIPYHSSRTHVDLAREHLTILPFASLRAITEECRTNRYTHVHILAHGVPFERGSDRRYGLALHHDRDPARQAIVDGAKLAAALRAHTMQHDRELARPTVVTLCTCDSGNAGGVMGAGASLAHELHAAGIPLVIASQFPLSMEGSVHLCVALYPALLRGDDPRIVLNDIRRRLLVLAPMHHDWASVVVYATFPPDLERQLRMTRRQQAERAIYVALTHIDAISRELPAKKKTSSSYLSPSVDLEARISEAEDRVRDPLAILTHLLQTQGQDEDDIPGLLAAARKRLAEVYYRASHIEALSEARRKRLREESERELREAYRCYLDAFEADRGATWALVQALVLGLTIGREPKVNDLRLARLLLERDGYSPPTNREPREWRRVSWAKRSLLELEFVELFCADEDPSTKSAIIERAYHHLRDMLELAQPNEEDLQSLRAQLDRYLYFFIDKILDETLDADRRAVNTISGMGEYKSRHRDRAQMSDRLEEVIRNVGAELDAYEGRRYGESQ